MQLRKITAVLVIISLMVPLCGIVSAAEVETSNVKDNETQQLVNEAPLKLNGKFITSVKRGGPYYDKGLTYTDENGKTYSIQCSKTTGKWTIKDENGNRVKELENEFKVFGKLVITKAGTYLRFYKLGKWWTLRAIVVYETDNGSGTSSSRDDRDRDYDDNNGGGNSSIGNNKPNPPKPTDPVNPGGPTDPENPDTPPKPEIPKDPTDEKDNNTSTPDQSKPAGDDNKEPEGPQDPTDEKDNNTDTPTESRPAGDGNQNTSDDTDTSESTGDDTSGGETNNDPAEKGDNEGSTPDTARPAG